MSNTMQPASLLMHLMARNANPFTAQQLLESTYPNIADRWKALTELADQLANYQTATVPPSLSHIKESGFFGWDASGVRVVEDDAGVVTSTNIEPLLFLVVRDVVKTEYEALASTLWATWTSSGHREHLRAAVNSKNPASWGKCWTQFWQTVMLAAAYILLNDPRALCFRTLLALWLAGYMPIGFDNAGELLVLAL